MVHDAGPNLFYQSLEARQRCCQVRKVDPMQRALASSQAWITGLRRDQSPSRANIDKVEIDSRNPDKIKLSPLAAWSSQQVWDYIHQNRLPYHSLYDRGYTSIGCSPCTRPTAAGESARAGRWWWEKGGGSECGLHVEQTQDASPQVSIDLLRQSARATATAARS
jgi:phosphoadenylyl-sulfate reductase (thioredoxin)